MGKFRLFASKYRLTILFASLAVLTILALVLSFPGFLPSELDMSATKKHQQSESCQDWNLTNSAVGCAGANSTKSVVSITEPQNGSQIQGTGSIFVSGTYKNNQPLARPATVNLTVDGETESSIQVKGLSANSSLGTWQAQLTIAAGNHSITALSDEKSTRNSTVFFSIIPSQSPHAETGVYIPMYSISTLNSFLSIMQSSGPTLPYIVSVNPNSGPGSSVDSTFTNAINTLHNSGLNVTVIGYVPTGYGTSRSVANVEGMIDTWYSLYPHIDGIMFDEVDNTASTDSFYKTITDYARAHGAHFLRGNPGTSIDSGKVAMFDMISIEESSGYPSLSALQSDTYYGRFGNGRFGCTIHDEPSLDAQWIFSAKQFLGLLYVTDGTEPNPYDKVPSYFAEELQALSASSAP